MNKTLTLLLIPAILSASIFMIMESGAYCANEFYQGNLLKGYWSVFLVEMFLGVFAVLYFKKRPYMNLFIKALMIILFLVMIAGASLNIITPFLTELSVTENNDRLVNYLLAENEKSEKALEKLKGQRTNTALQAKFQRELSKDIRTELKKENRNSIAIWLSILFPTFLRFAVQSANLIMAHILGVLYRENFKTKRKYTKKNKEYWGKFLRLVKKGA